MKTNNWRGGIGYIETYSDGTYQPVEDGKKAWIVSVDREVSDLVAWLPNKPIRWWLRRGIAPILNPEAIERAVHFELPLSVHRTPYQWLAAHRDGIVILDWRSNIPFWLSGVSRILTQDVHLAKKINSTFSLEIPEIRLESEVRHAA
ncbi:MAG: hypothetical protein HOC57_03510 [Rhodospirillaceae bacterium]|jgi:hypothetical protein|nr:hypothetical protein [Rhodospirillaceae bacterium]MBT4588326.1 hypothetical protein [Rhodospirillaceae bacterium]